MAVQFVFGRARSGKTQRCFRAIVEAMRENPLGPAIYWLLPPQATFDAERELTCASGLGAFSRAQVVSFEEFGREVFEDCGGSSIPEITPLGRQMIIGHLLRKNREQLKFYSRVARQPGLAAELDATFAEFERSGKTLADLDTAIADIAQTNAADLELAPLLDKLRDARLLYNAYSRYLGQDRLDQHRRLMQVESSLSRCSFLKGARIYVDGFLDFTENEKRILVGAAKAGADVEITLLMDPRSPIIDNPHGNPDEMGLFRRTEEAYRRLYVAFAAEHIDVNDPIRLRAFPPLPPGEGRGEGKPEAPFPRPSPQPSPRGRGSKAFSELEAGLFREPACPCDDSDGIELIESPDRAGEVDAAARAIRSLLMAGMRFREIGVLVRDLGNYDSLIRSAFKEHGIPFFLDRRRPASHHPLLEFVRSVFEIARRDWPHDAVMSLLRTGLCGIEPYDVDGLENYVLAHRIRGAAGWEAPKPWNYRRSIVGPEDPEQSLSAGAPDPVDALRRALLEKLSPLLLKLRADQPIAVRDFANEIFGTIERFGVRAKLAQWMKQSLDAEELERSAEHEQVWRNLVDLFEQLVELLGDERITPGEFFDVLESGLERFDLALTPPTVDQVLVGQVDRTRGATFRAVFVLGLSEGEFPRAASDSSILTDRDRRNLRARRIDLDRGATERLLDERLLAYIAFTRASERLILSRPLTNDEGRPSEPSVFWRRILQTFPRAAQTRMATQGPPAPADIATPRQLVTGLMRWVRSSSDPLATETDPAWSALYQWLAKQTGSDDAIAMIRDQVWSALSYSNEASLSPEIARELFRSPLRASASQMETFAACPFQHFARYALGLRETDRQEVTAADLGRLYHELLERSLKDVMRRRAEGDHTARFEQAVDQFVDHVGAALRSEIMLDGARHRYLLDRTRRTSKRLAIAQREQLKRGTFLPAQVGVRFGSGGNLPALRVASSSGEALLEGKIDRVDRVAGGQEIAVIDYRLGPSRLTMGMAFHGLALQLLVQLLVLEENGRRVSGDPVAPTAAFYVQLVRKIEDVKHPDESTDPADPKWHLRLKPRGIFDRRSLRSLDRQIETGWSEVVHAFVKQDGSLGHTHTSDAVESDQFRALLDIARKKLSELTEGILSGDIRIVPYRLNDKSPCPRCEFRSVCRFDPAINRYNHLPSISKAEFFATATGGNDAGAA
ncbi:MAG TPA: PD-(D/E)XK nuclease family protein [Tepidisphaeraceae bacterium]|nr:PD-(D/E)XK nuclease family protein [Tepidisphaeraceae bacterium]